MDAPHKDANTRMEGWKQKVVTKELRVCVNRYIAKESEMLCTFDYKSVVK